jgi:hypothetical protein
MRDVQESDDEDEPFYCDLCGGPPSALERFGPWWWFRCGSCGMSAIIPLWMDPGNASVVATR